VHHPDASPEIAEVKWFRASSGRLRCVLRDHQPGERGGGYRLAPTWARGATTALPGQISDPDRLLEWLAKDRCAAKFRDLNEVKAKRAALQDIVRQWIAHA
jgi:hypothetical protein